MSVSPQALNTMFNQRISSRDGLEKAASVAGDFIRDRLREVSFVRKVLPPENVNRNDPGVQVSTNHDTLIKIVEIEPTSRAMAFDFRGSPTVRYIRGERAEVGFFTISSEMFQKTEQELLAYNMPITKILEENSVKDIQEIEDREFVIHIEAACQTLQLEANGGVATALNNTNIQAGTVVEFSIRKGELARSASGSPDATVRPIQRTDVPGGRKMLSGNRLRCERMLMTEPDWDDIITWTVEDNGDRIQSETVVEGYKYNTLCGLPYIRTIKTDILRPGNIYFFAAPQFFGKFYILNQTKFYIDKVANRISFQAWEDVGMSVINIAAVRKIELYSADANPSTNADSLLANFIPKAEDELGAVNNRVESGLKFPKLSQY